MSTKKINLVWSQSPLMDISNNNKTNRKVKNMSTCSDGLYIRYYQSHSGEWRNKRHSSRFHHCSPTLPAYERDNSESDVKVLVPVFETYQKSVYFRFYRLTYKYQRYENDVASEMEIVKDGRCIDNISSVYRKRLNIGYKFLDRI